MRLESGDKRLFRREAKPLGSGGYAHVYAAVHKPTGERVAFKELMDTLGDALPRMRREIDVMRQLTGTAGVMPILDADDRKHSWYVMPLADGDLKVLSGTLEAGDLVKLAGDVARGLRVAHDRGFIHRDVTPTNVLRMPDGDWVIADWGVVRRPLGMTTRRLTEVDKPIGTEGFIAPELLRDPHREASPASDVYSLGQVMAFAASGHWPLAGERRPPVGPWRRWVRDAIAEAPENRPELHSLVERLTEVGYQPPERAPERAAELADAAAAGDDTAAWRLLELADENLDDAELFYDYLPSVKGPALDRLVGDDQMAERLVEAMRTWLDDHHAWDRRNFDNYNWVLAWLHEVIAAATRQGRLGVLEDTADALFAVDYRLDRFRDRDRTHRWLVRADGHEAEVIARALRRAPETVGWIVQAWEPSGLHPDIADALQLATSRRT